MSKQTKTGVTLSFSNELFRDSELEVHIWEDHTRYSTNITIIDRKGRYPFYKVTEGSGVPMHLIEYESLFDFIASIMSPGWNRKFRLGEDLDMSK
ncbi:MAG: hypothetical protein ABIH76_05915 [Candidatus Bathyarchaeota archaeon]